ncbi:MAG: Xaa-Pro peptidase family protein [Lachnospiraceae bacterium]|nr:Xaa-Pro peptidase family protein [Lachnospiraceae bacterium]
MKTYAELFWEEEYPVLLTSPQNIFYVTDFYTTARRPGQIGYNCVLMTPEKNYFFIPAGWKSLIEEEWSDARTELVPYRGDMRVLGRKILEIAGKAQTREKAEKGETPSAGENRKDISCIGYEREDLSLDLFLTLQEQNSGWKWLDVSPVMKKARLVKSEMEIARLRESASVAKAAMEYAKELLLPGKKELEVVAGLEYFMRRNGSEGVPFTMKVLTGENAVRTVNLPGNREIQEGEIVLLDFGATIHNYASDWTRSFCIGKANENQRELYRLVWEIERSCIAMIRPGVTYGQLMQKAFEMIKGHPWEDYFNPYLGHSIGISSQEWPPINPDTNQVLTENMVITIEPGVYVPGVGGVRIEDEVLVTAAGHEILTGLEREEFELNLSGI